MICLYCGSEFETSRLTARYCPEKDCKKLAEKDRNASPSKDGNKTNTNGGRVCAYCGKPLKKGMSYKARYCPGGACKQASYRERKERANA